MCYVETLYVFVQSIFFLFDSLMCIVYFASLRSVVILNLLFYHCFMFFSFGHQDCVTAIDSLYRETCVTVGGRDRTARLFKIADVCHFVFVFE